jgi:hypothetical protein
MQRSGAWWSYRLISSQGYVSPADARAFLELALETTSRSSISSAAPTARNAKSSVRDRFIFGWGGVDKGRFLRHI